MQRQKTSRAETPGRRVGVVVFQLGGPDSLDAVEPFLYNLFSDPDIIDFPFARLARPTLARLIASRRARHVQEHYAAIGGRSPIGELTERQRAALERELRGSRGLDARVFVAMRYWHPLTAAAVAEIQRGDFSELVLLPLYPQYSRTTTGSSLNEWRRLHDANGHRPIPTRTIQCFYDHPAYLDAMVEKINEGLARFRPAAPTDPRLRGDDDPGNVILSQPDEGRRSEESRHSELMKTPSGLQPEWVLEKTLRPLRRAQGDSERAQGDERRQTLPKSSVLAEESAQSADDVHLVFSAHGVPLRVIEAGDPYQRHIEETVKLVMARGGWANPHVLCYQSRVSPGKWLAPTLGETLHAIAGVRSSAHLQAGTTLNDDQAGRAPSGAGATSPGKRVLVIPISFVTDHVETLAEVDIEARRLADSLGITQFELMPALNDSPAFIRALAELVVAGGENRPPAEPSRAHS
ncbi:MAG: ferrochelatase [Terriglobia bacterium]